MKTLDCTPAVPAVLIVNGDADMLAELADTVLAGGFRVIALRTAGEYFASAQPHAATCAILDVVLPDGRAIEVQEALAESGTPVVFATRERRIDFCIRAFKGGAMDFLTLPCRSETLLAAVHNAIGEALRARAERERQAELRDRLQRLTQRERQVFSLVASGLLNKQVAEQLSIAEITVQIHRSRVMKKMAARSLAALVRMADALHMPVLQCSRGSAHPKWAVA